MKKKGHKQGTSSNENSVAMSLVFSGQSGCIIFKPCQGPYAPCAQNHQGTQPAKHHHRHEPPRGEGSASKWGSLTILLGPNLDDKPPVL